MRVENYLIMRWVIIGQSIPRALTIWQQRSLATPHPNTALSSYRIIVFANLLRHPTSRGSATLSQPGPCLYLEVFLSFFWHSRRYDDTLASFLIIHRLLAVYCIFKRRIPSIDVIVVVWVI